MQTLVGAAGEALGIVEDPLTTLVGSKVTKHAKKLNRMRLNH